VYLKILILYTPSKYYQDDLPLRVTIMILYFIYLYILFIYLYVLRSLHNNDLDVIS